MQTKITLTVTHITVFSEVENRANVITVPVRLTQKQCKEMIQDGEYYLKHDHEKQEFEISQEELHLFLTTNGTQLLGGNK